MLPVLLLLLGAGQLALAQGEEVGTSCRSSASDPYSLFGTKTSYFELAPELEDEPSISYPGEDEKENVANDTV